MSVLGFEVTNLQSASLPNNALCGDGLGVDSGAVLDRRRWRCARGSQRRLHLASTSPRSSTSSISRSRLALSRTVESSTLSSLS